MVKPSDFFDAFVPQNPDSEEAIHSLQKHLEEKEVLSDLQSGLNGQYLIIIDRNILIHGRDINLLRARAREIMPICNLIEKYVTTEGQIEDFANQIETVFNK